MAKVAILSLYGVMKSQLKYKCVQQDLHKRYDTSISIKRGFNEQEEHNYSCGFMRKSQVDAHEMPCLPSIKTRPSGFFS
jgi:hypothetical protein